MAITQDDMDQAIYILYPQNQHAWPEGKFATANDLFWPDSNPDPKPKISDIKTKAEEIANAGKELVKILSSIEEEMIQLRE
mgnify:CR=1 FL=1